MSALALPFRSVKIETTEENAHKLAALLRTIQTGELDGVVIRPPMQVQDMARILGVSRNTLRKWREFDKRVFVMPLPANLRSIAKDLLGVKESRLEEYFQGVLTLKELLEIHAESHSLEDIYHIYRTLQEPDKDALLALLLSDRAKDLGNVIRDTYRNPVSSKTKKVIQGDEDTDVASNLGEGLTPKAAERLRNLLIASQDKHRRLTGERLDFYEILRREGVSSNLALAVEAIDAVLAQRISGEYGPRLIPSDWVAFATICFQVSGWRNNQPERLLDQTFHDRVDLLKRTLLENGEPHPVVRE